MIRVRKIRRERTPVDPSRALTSNIYVPAPEGLIYDPYQLAGIEYASKRFKTLVGDDPGSGKTIMAIGFSNLFPELKRILIICPGFLKPHWKKEWLKWDTKGLDVGVAERLNGVFPNTNVCIINYDILKGYRTQLRAVEWDLMIVDEVHKLKSKKADRTREVWGGIKRDKHKKIIERVSPIDCRYELGLTGTPSLNGKPKELWNLLQRFDPQGLGKDWFTYASRYCKLQEITQPEWSANKGRFEQKHVGWIWDEADNLEELQTLMRERFMVRRLKSEIMPQLKPKRRMIIPISMNKTIKKILGKEGLDYETTAREIKDIESAEFGEFSKAMLQVGLALIDPTVEIIESDLEEYDKIVIMCFHKEVARKIEEKLNGVVRIDGDVSSDDRQNLVDRFQNDPSCRIFIGTIGSCGVGFTLTSSHLMIFPERSFVPGDVTQAEDRIHRRGQFEQAVYKHLVLENSQSERQVKVLIEKQDKNDLMLDKKLDKKVGV